MTPTLPPAWQALLKDELQKPYWCSLEQRLGAAYESGAVYPPAQQLFAAFERTPPTCVRASGRTRIMSRGRQTGWLFL